MWFAEVAKVGKMSCVIDRPFIVDSRRLHSATTIAAIIVAKVTLQHFTRLTGMPEPLLAIVVECYSM